MLVLQFPPLSILLPAHAHNGASQSVILTVLFFTAVFVQIVPGLGSGSGFFLGFGHGHRKRYFGLFQQFIALCYFAEQVFWSSVLPVSVSVSLSMYLCLCLCLCSLSCSLLALKTGSQCLRNRNSTGDSTHCVQF